MACRVPLQKRMGNAVSSIELDQTDQAFCRFLVELPDLHSHLSLPNLVTIVQCLVWITGHRAMMGGIIPSKTGS